MCLSSDLHESGKKMHHCLIALMWMIRLVILEGTINLQIFAFKINLAETSTTCNYWVQPAWIVCENKDTFILSSVPSWNAPKFCLDLGFEPRRCRNQFKCVTSSKPEHHSRIPVQFQTFELSNATHAMFFLGLVNHEFGNVNGGGAKPHIFSKPLWMHNVCQLGNYFFLSSPAFRMCYFCNLSSSLQVPEEVFKQCCNVQKVYTRSFLCYLNSKYLQYSSATNYFKLTVLLANICNVEAYRTVSMFYNKSALVANIIVRSSETMNNLNHRFWPMSDTLNVMETTFKERDPTGGKHQIQTKRDSTPYYQAAIGQSVNTAVHYRQDYNFWQEKGSLSKKRHDTPKQKKKENEIIQKQDLTLKNAVKEVSIKSVSSLLTVSCTLHLVADYLFYKHVGKGDVSRTVNIMKKTVYGADAIFRSTDFNLDGAGDNIGFMIKNITVLSDESMDFFSYSMDNTDYMGYLRNFSRANFSGYCLGVAFTYKEFKHSVGGVAWIASSSTQVYPGGICQNQLFMKREKAYFSFNSLAISFFNPWHMLNAETAALTLAHELGHSFGSTHDQMTNSKCRFGDPGGNYLMNHYSSTGELPNNYKFSPCSIRLMYPVIAKKGNCFLQYVGNHCGNGVKEEGEECDCGTSGTCEFNDPCCTPADTPHGSLDIPCMVRKSLGKMCSPASSPCCTNDCKIITNFSKVCKESTECHSQAVCDGIVPWCPEPVRRPNGSMCESETRFCLAGQCAGSVCNIHGFSDCLCISKADNQCKLCCRKTNSSECLPAEVLGILSTENKTIFLGYGEPCWNLEAGFCDKDHKCLPYLDFVGMVFAAESQDNFRLWMLNYWLYLSGGFAFFLVCIFLFIIWSTSYFKDVHMRAVQYGSILGIMMICEVVQFKLHVSLANNESLLDNLISRIQNGNCPEIFVEAISRLRTLFPTAPLSHLIRTALASTSEDVAVRILLAKGYPMRRFLTRKPSIFSPGGGPENGSQGQCEQNRQMTKTDQLRFHAPSHSSCQDHPEQPKDKIQHETHRARSKNISCLEQELTINRHFLVHHFSQSHVQPSNSVQVIHSTDVVYMNLATNSDNVDNVAAASNDADSDHGSSICGTSVDREPTDFSISISSCSTKHETWLDMSLSAIISTTMTPESGQEASDKQSWFKWFVQKLLDPFRKQEILPETLESCAQCTSTSGLKERESSGDKKDSITQKLPLVITTEVATQTEDIQKTSDKQFSSTKDLYVSLVLKNEKMNTTYPAEEASSSSFSMKNYLNYHFPHSDNLYNLSVPSTSAAEGSVIQNTVAKSENVCFKQNQEKINWKQCIPYSRSKKINVQKQFISSLPKTSISEPHTSVLVDVPVISQSLDDLQNIHSEKETIIVPKQSNIQRKKYIVKYS